MPTEINARMQRNIFQKHPNNRYMLIYNKRIDNKLYVYIHIPKNSGKFIRNQIFKDKKNKVVISLWGVDSIHNIDLAHTPYIKSMQFLENTKCINKHCNFIANMKRKWLFCCNSCINGTHGPFCGKLNPSKIDFTNCIYYSFSRNPYDRIISAFFYIKEEEKKVATIAEFREFCKRTLPTFVFDFSYNANYIHYYPQYMFLCDENFQISNVKVEKLESSLKPTKYDLKKYFDNECISIINTIYEKDFILLNYDRIDPF